MKPHEMMRALIDSGVSQREVGKLIGLHQSQVSRTIKKKKDILYSPGKALESLYIERFPSLYKRSSKIN